MYISSLHKNNKGAFRLKLLCYFIIVIFVMIFTLIRFINVCIPFVENRAKYIAIDIINHGVNNYLAENEKIFSQVIDISNLNTGRVSSALVNTYNINLIKSGLSVKLSSDFDEIKTYTVRIPVSNITGINCLAGIGVPLSIKIEPSSRVKVDFENNFSASGINQTHYSLALKIKADVMVVLPGIRKNVCVETLVPVGEAVFMGEVPSHFLNFDR